MLSADEILINEIRQAVERVVQNRKEEFIQKAVNDYEKDLREAIGDQAIRVSDYFSFERLEREIRIICHVKRTNP